METAPKAGPHKNPFRVTPFLLPHWKSLTLGIISAIVSCGASLAQPWPLKIVIDYVIGTKLKAMPNLLGRVLDATVGRNPLAIVEVSALSLIAIAFAGALASYSENLLMTRVGQWVMHDLRTALYDHIQRLSLSFINKSRTADLTGRVTDDIDTIQGFITSTLMDSFMDALTLSGIIVIMSLMNWKFTLVSLAIVPVLFIFVYNYTHRIKGATRAVRKKESEIMSNVQEVFSSLEVVKAFSREKYERQRFEQESLASVELTLRARTLKAGLSPGVDAIVSFGSALVLWYGARLVLQGVLPLGDLTVFLWYLGKLYSPIRGLSKLPDSFTRPAIAFERVQEIMEVEVKDPDHANLKKAPAFKGLIEFENVNFAYRPDQPILKDVSFRIEPGQIVAFVGPTGSGKTTIISLVPRFYEANSGIVRIDGEDVRGLTLKSLRKQLGFVLQETTLFRAPIWQNIAYGRPSATREEIIEAAKKANAHDFIEQMPDEYDTMVGERGVTISGGQRQRLGIARAIVRDAPILILDEPTSGLDMISEAIVFDALHRLMAGRTCIVITHRLTTIVNADVIFVLSGGSIVERGTHSELLRTSGLYAELCDTASAGKGLTQSSSSSSPSAGGDKSI